MHPVMWGRTYERRRHKLRANATGLDDIAKLATDSAGSSDKDLASVSCVNTATDLKDI